MMTVLVCLVAWAIGLVAGFIGGYWIGKDRIAQINTCKTCKAAMRIKIREIGAKGDCWIQEKECPVCNQTSALGEGNR